MDRAHDGESERSPDSNLREQAHPCLLVDKMGVGSGGTGRGHRDGRIARKRRGDPASEQRGRSDTAQTANDHCEEEEAQFFEEGMRWLGNWVHGSEVVKFKADVDGAA